MHQQASLIQRQQTGVLVDICGFTPTKTPPSLMLILYAKLT